MFTDELLYEGVSFEDEIRKIYMIVILFDYDSIKILMNYLVAGAALPVELLYS